MPEQLALGSLCLGIGGLLGFAAGWLIFRKRLYLDDATGLLNQRAIISTLSRRFRQAAVRRTPLGVALLDINDFKGVNTRFGYDAADKLLRQFAERMSRECSQRGVDVLRYRSGDEFLLVMSDMDENSCDRFIKDLGRVLCENPFQIEGSDYRLSFVVGMRSIGGAGKNELPDLRSGIREILADCENRLAKGKAQHPSDRLSSDTARAGRSPENP